MKRRPPYTLDLSEEDRAALERIRVSIPGCKSAADAIRNMIRNRDPAATAAKDDVGNNGRQALRGATSAHPGEPRNALVDIVGIQLGAPPPKPGSRLKSEKRK